MDCDDGDRDRYPGAAEECNGIDDDCDGEIDDDPVDDRTYYRDRDDDGHGDPEHAMEACEAPEMYVESYDDCDDTNRSRYPGAPETCADPPYDYNCDGVLTYRDADGDGHPACRDCDDDALEVSPDGREECNGIDDDCDGAVDESGGDETLWYRDEDTDGFGDPRVAELACNPPWGYVANMDDCNDADADANPGATETCNDVDDDCDGRTDEPGAVGETDWYVDYDGDGSGSDRIVHRSCVRPLGFVTSDTDCDDTDAQVGPGAAEPCDGVDNDCDGAIDDSCS